MPHDRRCQRSDHFPRALRLQLAASARRGGYRSLVLTGQTGMVLASAGDPREVEELAWASVKIAPRRRPWQGQLHSATGVRRIAVTPIDCRLGRFYLCAISDPGGEDAGALLDGGRGVARILDRHCQLRAA